MIAVRRMLTEQHMFIISATYYPVHITYMYMSDVDLSLPTVHHRHMYHDVHNHLYFALCSFYTLYIQI